MNDITNTNRCASAHSKAKGTALSVQQEQQQQQCPRASQKLKQQEREKCMRYVIISKVAFADN